MYRHIHKCKSMPSRYTDAKLRSDLRKAGLQEITLDKQSLVKILWNMKENISA